MNGGWTTWSQWNACNVSCGEGMQLRFRSCNNPTPAFSGLKCGTKDSETKQCYHEECPKGIPIYDWKLNVVKRKQIF